MAVLESFLIALFPVTVYAVYVTVYRLFYHPLARFPGPKLAAVSSLYEIYYDILSGPNTSFMDEIRRMHKVYGPIVRVTPHEIHVSDPEFFETIYTNPSGGRRHKYLPHAQQFGNRYSFFGTPEAHIHRRRRAVISPMFTRRSILAVQPMIHTKLDKLLAFILDECASEKSVRKGVCIARKAFLAFALDVACAQLFDTQLNILDDHTKADTWLVAMASAFEGVTIGRQLPGLMSWLMEQDPKVVSVLMPPAKEFMAFNSHLKLEAQAVIKQAERGELSDVEKVVLHVESESTAASETIGVKYDIFRQIMGSSLPAEDKAADRMSQEGTGILFAGGETIAKTLTSAMFFILNDWETVGLSIRREVDSLKQPFDLVELENCEYLTAVIKETHRIAAVVTSRTAQIADEPLIYGDWVIPSGTPVSSSIRDVLHDSDIFPEPRQFKPERWLQQNPDLDRIKRFEVWYSKGSRGCAGLNLAQAEMYLTIATLVNRLDMKLVDTIRERDVDLVRDCFVGETSLETTGVKISAAERIK